MTSAMGSHHFLPCGPLLECTGKVIWSAVTILSPLLPVFRSMSVTASAGLSEDAVSSLDSLLRRILLLHLCAALSASLRVTPTWGHTPKSPTNDLAADLLAQSKWREWFPRTPQTSRLVAAAQMKSDSVLVTAGVECTH